MPPLDPPKTTPPAVAITPAHGGDFRGNSQTTLPVECSSARIEPLGSTVGTPRGFPPPNHWPGTYESFSLTKYAGSSRTPTYMSFVSGLKLGLNQFVAP